MCNPNSLANDKMENSNYNQKHEHKKDEAALSEMHEHLSQTEEETSNEYVLNVAFFSFLIFMAAQAIFALIAKSQAMLADSLAMSVDAFTYLFNLYAEKLKHRSNRTDVAEDVPLEERKRRKKIQRLWLEIVPPSISVTALVYVSTQTLMEAIATLKNPSLGGSDDEPDVNLMLLFSALNLALDMMNVSCFSKVQNFSITGDMTVNGEEQTHFLVQVGPETTEISPSKRIREFPPSIIVDTSLDSSYESAVASENEGLLGIPLPNYGSRKDDTQWGEEFSLDAVCGENESDGLTSEGVSIASIETGDSNSAFSNSKSVLKSGGASLDIGPEELGDISEGDENTESDIESKDEENGYSDDNDSEKSGRGFNLNMCSAYTHVMADTLRSIAVLVAAALSFSVKGIDPSIADATASIVVSVIIAASLGPLIVGLLKTVGELKALKSIENQRLPWMEQYQHLPSMSPRLIRRRQSKA